jgi:hypothetical protein
MSDDLVDACGSFTIIIYFYVKCLNVCLYCFIHYYSIVTISTSYEFVFCMDLWKMFNKLKFKLNLQKELNMLDWKVSGYSTDFWKWAVVTNGPNLFASPI